MNILPRRILATEISSPCALGHKESVAWDETLRKCYVHRASPILTLCLRISRWGCSRSKTWFVVRNADRRTSSIPASRSAASTTSAPNAAVPSNSTRRRQANRTRSGSIRRNPIPAMPQPPAPLAVAFAWQFCELAERKRSSSAGSARRFRNWCWRSSCRACFRLVIAICEWWF